jgi:hypothetical protein
MTRCAFHRAGESVEEPIPSTRTSAADPWLSSSGFVAHPDAPLGGGGPGIFTGANPLGSNSNLQDPVPHPLAPAARGLDPGLLADKAEELAQPVQQPAPVVAADEKKTVGGIEVTVKKDKSGVAGVTGAATSFEMDPGTTPDVEIDDKTKKITKILGPMPVLTATIETDYGKGSGPDGKSAYGRATTDDDKKKGNTSLGFHESCHRQNHLDFVKANAVPKFGGTVGMTEDEWNKATEKYTQAVEDYAKKSDQNSGKLTDEVGDPTKSEYKKTHP